MNLLIPVIILTGGMDTNTVKSGYLPAVHQTEIPETNNTEFTIR